MIEKSTMSRVDSLKVAVDGKSLFFLCTWNDSEIISFLLLLVRNLGRRRFPQFYLKKKKRLKKIERLNEEKKMNKNVCFIFIANIKIDPTCWSVAQHKNNF